MGHIIADKEMELSLRGILEPIEIRDALGQLLGHYVPYVSPERKAFYREDEPALRFGRSQASRGN